MIIKLSYIISHFISVLRPLESHLEIAWTWWIIFLFRELSGRFFKFQQTNLGSAIFVAVKLMGQFNSIENNDMFWFYKKINPEDRIDALKGWILNATIKCNLVTRKSI